MGLSTVSPLLAVLLVTSSSRGASVVFQYPRRPKLEKRYSKIRYHVGEEEGGNGGVEDQQYDLQQDEMDDDFGGDVELSDDDESSESSDSSSSDIAELDEDRSEWDGAYNRRDFDVASSSAGGNGTETGRELEERQKRLRAYQQYLGYDVDILASILSPKRELCHRKFELVIDDLAFIGHPVCVDTDGKWDVDLQQQQQQQMAARGRDQSRKGDTSLGGYTIGEEAPADEPSINKSSQAPPMRMFHFVLVLDRPDPSPNLPTLDLTTWLQIFYDNIAFKTTAALFAEEVRCEYVSRESEMLIALRDRCMDDAQSYASFLTQELHFSSLARSLQQIYSSVSLSANAFITVNEAIDVHLQLPPILHDPTRMLRIADVETPIDPNDAIYSRGDSSGPVDIDDLIFEEWTRTTGPFLLPWKTLLLLSGEGASDQDHDRQIDELSNLDYTADQRVDSWAKKFTSLLRPTLDGIPTFAEIADLLDWSLDDDVYPMVRHLIYYREARVIDVPRIQNYYAISPLFDLSELARLSTSWALRFSALPPLVAFLAKLSASLMPFSSLCRKDQRLLCLDALVWLLRHQVIVQMHVRLRLIANEGSKKRAADIRRAERERISEQKARRQAILDQRSGRNSMLLVRSAIDSNVDNFPHSAPAASAATTGTLPEAGQTKERGRNRERSKSPGFDVAGGDNEPVLSPKITSALSATRPDQDHQMLDSGSFVAAASPQPSLPAVKALVSKVEELKFERRPVLRSRSPSQMLAMASEKAGSSVRTRGSSGGSRPSTPRGRGRGFAVPRETSGTVPIGDAPVTQAHSVPASTIQQQQSKHQRPHRSTTRERKSKNGTSRSPSRARMRVTGFGEGEEVFVENEPRDVAGVPPTKTTASNTEAAAGGVGRVMLESAADFDEHRRLSLVGEEAEADASAILAREEEAQRKAMLSDDEFDAEEYLNEEEMEIESWETDPIATIIVEPGRAGGEENEWIAVMVENRPELLVHRFFKLLPFLNGKHTIDEIVYRLDWRRKDLRGVLVAFKEEILTLVHP